MAPGSSLGTATMLRARRKDVNVKPNRRLDRKSSRGMLYENEELRLRTININAEVERGQSDIKKLRRENEQLRREIWGLRDEYDRLESLLGQLQGNEQQEHPEQRESKIAEEGGVSNDEDLNVPTQTSGNSARVEYDGLSVVDEETEESPLKNLESTSNVYEIGCQKGSAFTEQRRNGCLSSQNNIGICTNNMNVSSRRSNVMHNYHFEAQNIYSRNHIFNNQPNEYAALPEFRENSLCNPAFIESSWSENRSNPVFRKTKPYDSNIGNEKEMKLCNVVNLNEGKQFLSLDDQKNVFGHACSNSGNTATSYPCTVQDCFVPIVENRTTSFIFSENSNVRGGPDIFISGAYPVNTSRSRFPVVGALDQLLRDVHESSVDPQSPGHKNWSQEDVLQELHIKETDINGEHPDALPSPAEKTYEGNKTSREAEVMQGNKVALLSSHLGTLRVGGIQRECEGSADRFRSQIKIQLQPATQQTFADTNHGVIHQRTNETEVIISDTFAGSSKKIANSPVKESDNYLSNYPNKDPLFRQVYCKTAPECSYKSFVASNPELSCSNTRLLSNSAQDINCPPLYANIMEEETSQPFSHSQSTSDIGAKLSQCYFPFPKKQMQFHKKCVGDSRENLSNTVSRSYDTENTVSNTIHEVDRNSIALADCNASRVNISSGISVQTSVPLLTADNSDYISPLNMPEMNKNNSEMSPCPNVNFPPTPVDIRREKGRRVHSGLHLGVEELQDAYFPQEKREVLSRLNYPNVHGPGTENTSMREPVFHNISRKDPGHRPQLTNNQKMSVLVGDTQHGRSCENGWSSSSGQDSPTKLDTRRRTSVNIHNRRRHGVVHRRDLGGSEGSEYMLTRSVSLDPAKSCPVTPVFSTAVSSNELADRERTNSVTSKTSTATVGTNKTKGAFNQTTVTKIESNSVDKSVPWCACWGNGCI